MEILLLILGLMLFVVLIVVHEWGHFIMARRNGVNVEEFGIGFPPKIWTFHKDNKGTVYTLNALPLGGFVRLKGEHDADRAKGSFGAAKFWAKTKIILAGVVMNLFVAWVLFTLLALIGMPKLSLPGGEEQFSVASDTRIVSNRVFVSYVEPEGPADKVGLEPGDELISITSRSYQDYCNASLDGSCELPPYEATQVRSRVEELLKTGDTTLQITAARNGKTSMYDVQPRSIQEVADALKTDTPKGYLGIVPQDFTVQRSTWSAPIVGVGVIGQFSKLTYEAIGGSIVHLFQGRGEEASDNVSGPLGIFFVLRDGATLGINYIILIIASLSLTLAIMNTLPIPALDGGKLAVMTIFRVLKKPLSSSLEEKIHGTGFVLLMGLFVLITIVDVRRFF